MSALTLIAIFVAWFALGYSIWRNVIARQILGSRSRAIYGGLLSVLWMSSPWFDELSGAINFKLLCSEMPPARFLGPVAVGPGPFFDERGDPTWVNSEELAEIMGRHWKTIFHSREEVEEISSFPIPILERRIVTYYAESGETVEILTDRSSPGGWLKRITGVGFHAPYQCPWKKYRPHANSDYVVFSK